MRRRYVWRPYAARAYKNKNEELRTRIEDIVRKAEETGEQRYTKKAHKTMRLLSRKRNSQRKPVKDKNGTARPDED